MKTFHVGDILSITTGALVSPNHLDGVYRILNWLTEDDLFTHQLTRAARECEGFLREQFPQLPTEAPEFTGDKDAVVAAVFAWVDSVAAEHGAYFEVPRMPTEDHTRIDPLAELRMRWPNVPIVIVEGGESR